MLITCLILALKSEDVRIDKTYYSFIKEISTTDPNEILGAEITLLNAMKFDLLCFSPYKILDGILSLLKKLNIEEPSELRKSIAEFIDNSFLSDAIFLYPPALICYAGIKKVNEEIYAKLKCTEDSKILSHIIDLVNISVIDKHSFQLSFQKLIVFHKMYPEFMEKIRFKKGLILEPSISKRKFNPKQGNQDKKEEKKN